MILEETVGGKYYFLTSTDSKWLPKIKRLKSFEYLLAHLTGWRARIIEKEGTQFLQFKPPGLGWGRALYKVKALGSCELNEVPSTWYYSVDFAAFISNVPE